MQKIFSFLLIALLSNLLFIPFSKAEEEKLPAIPLEKKTFQDKKDKNYQKGEIIVQYKSKAKKEKALAEIKNLTDKKNLTLEIKGEVGDLNLTLIKSSTKSTQDLIEEFKNDETVALVEPNYKRTWAFAPNDPYYPQQWSINNTGQSVAGVSGLVDADIDASEAWDIESDTATDIVVAVIDDGVQYDHVDLMNNMWDGTVCVDDLGNAIGGGCPNHGWDYGDNDNDPYGEEHGTLIASLIAGENNNNAGVSGLSRYNHLKVMALKFDLTVFAELKAINFAKNNGAKVINASFVGDEFSQVEKTLIESFDGIFVAAAGNGGVDETGDNNDSTPIYPCSYDSTNIICVASSDQNDTLSTFSNYGTVSVDIAAPGENLTGIYQKSYYIGSGTSFATPLVTGTAALLFSTDTSLTAENVKNNIISSGDLLPALAEKTVSGKRLNLNNAYQLAAEIPPVPEPTPTPAPITQVDSTVEDAKAADFLLYEKYLGYQNYLKYEKFKKYKKAKEKYGFKNSTERLRHKLAYENFKLFKENPFKYKQYAVLLSEYKKYKKYKNEYAPLKKYAKYKKYDKREYTAYRNYGSSEYKAGYERYLNY